MNDATSESYDATDATDATVLAAHTRLRAITGAPLVVACWAGLLTLLRGAHAGPAAFTDGMPEAPRWAAALVGAAATLTLTHVALALRAGPRPDGATAGDRPLRLGAGILTLTGAALAFAKLAPWAYGGDSTASLYRDAMQTLGTTPGAVTASFTAATAGVYVMEALAADVHALLPGAAPPPGSDAARARIRLAWTAGLLIALTLFGMTLHVVRYFSAGAPLFA